MKYVDHLLVKQTIQPFGLKVGSMISVFVISILFIKVIITSERIEEQIIFLIGFIFLLLWVYAVFFSIIEERRFVRNIKVTASSVEIENAFHKIKKIRGEDIKFVSDIEEKWILPKPHYWKVEKKGITIKLNNGKFYRISPHMENIEELKTKLDKLIDEYKN